MFKVVLDASSEALYNIFLVIWKDEDIPSDWSNDLIFNLPKQGYQRKCDNSREIKLLSVPSKVFCNILLKRFDETVDKKPKRKTRRF